MIQRKAVNTGEIVVLFMNGFKRKNISAENLERDLLELFNKEDDNFYWWLFNHFTIDVNKKDFSDEVTLFYAMVVLNKNQIKPFLRLVDPYIVDLNYMTVGVYPFEIEMINFHFFPIAKDPLAITNLKNLVDREYYQSEREYLCSGIFPQIWDDGTIIAVHGTSGPLTKQGGKNLAPKWITLEKTNPDGTKEIFDYSRSDNSRRKIPVQTLQEMEDRIDKFWQELRENIDVSEKKRFEIQGKNNAGNE